MELNHAEFMNVVLEKTTKKMNELQATVLVLETQLQLAVEQNKKQLAELDKLKKKT